MRRRGVIVVLACLLSALGGCVRAPVFQGRVLEPPRPELDFTLKDQFDQPVQLSRLHGRVVVLTFLYTTCPDICPLVTSRLREVANLIAKHQGQVHFVAVTVDPDRDTVQAVADYSRRWQMLDRWSFLTGPERQLEPIWEYYWVGRIGPGQFRPLSGAAADRVGHGSPIHLLDRNGEIRVIHDADFRPAALAHDIEALIAERAKAGTGRQRHRSRRPPR